MAKMPQQKPGKSEQSVETPDELIVAVKRRLCIEEFSIDLAADVQNAKAAFYYDEKTNALEQPWMTVRGWNWCNPPYANLKLWTLKSFNETVEFGAHTAMLVPAAPGANWWRDWVDGIAHVLFLNGRVTFKGHDKPYPKDLALLLYSPIVWGGYEVWSWKWKVENE